MDDMIMLGESKQQMWDCLGLMDDFLQSQLGLQMKQHLYYVKEAYSRGEVPLEYALDVMQSYLGLLKHTDSKALREKICEDYVLIRKSAPDLEMTLQMAIFSFWFSMQASALAKAA